MWDLPLVQEKNLCTADLKNPEKDEKLHSE
jgi:hypothetical protein